ncbi:ATP-binding protein [Streptomyces libani]|uniref:ATP-binding protein n=1 Tax=Streptomyces nigrescens TaxID=1920 RepID=UPI0038287DB1
MFREASPYRLDVSDHRRPRSRQAIMKIPYPPPPPGQEADDHHCRRHRRVGHGTPGRSEYLPPCGDHTSSRLAHRPESVGHARQIVGTSLHRWQLPAEASASVLLVVSELVTNAVQHARPPLALYVRLEHPGPRVWVGITDGGPATRKGAWAASRDQDEHGRGLEIVNALSTTHGSRHHEGGTTHWARFDLPP